MNVAPASPGWAVLSLSFVSACVWTDPVAPGPGEVSRDSQTRHGNQVSAAKAAAAERARAFSEADPTDARMLRKAGELAVRALEDSRGDTRDVIFTRSAKVAERLSQTGDCDDATWAGHVYALAYKDEPAISMYTKAVKSCGSFEAAIRAQPIFRRQGHCEGAIELLRLAWQASPPQSRWETLFEAVEACSTQVTFEHNLSFVPAHIREAYIAKREEERVAREIARERARFEADREHSRSQCRGHCSNARSRCESGCSGNSSCYSMCGSVESSCLAGCT